MGNEPERWEVDELRPEHERAAFACGHPSLDAYLRQYASQNERTGVSRTFVAVRPAQTIVLGYYSLSAGSVELTNLTDEQRRRLPRYPLPVAHLGRLAVDRNAQGQGLGEHLLLDALGRIARVGEDIGIHAVEVVAIDDGAKRFYLKYGFVALRDDPHHLYIPMKVVRQLGLA